MKRKFRKWKTYMKNEIIEKKRKFCIKYHRNGIEDNFYNKEIGFMIFVENFKMSVELICQPYLLSSLILKIEMCMLVCHKMADITTCHKGALSHDYPCEGQTAATNVFIWNERIFERQRNIRTGGQFCEPFVVTYETLFYNIFCDFTTGVGGSIYKW